MASGGVAEVLRCWSSLIPSSARSVYGAPDWTILRATWRSDLEEWWDQEGKEANWMRRREEQKYLSSLASQTVAR